MTTTATFMRVTLAGEGKDDDSASPHVNTFRELHKSGTPPPFASNPSSEESNTSSDNDLTAGEDHQSGMNQEDLTSQVSQVAQEKEVGATDDERESVLRESVLRLVTDGVVKNISPQHLQMSESKSPTELFKYALKSSICRNCASLVT